MKLLEITGKPAWATPVLIVLGFASSLAETIGISLILLFVYSVTGHVGGPGNGIVPTLLSYISDWLGGSTWLALLIFFTILARACLGMTYERISAKIGDQITETVRNLIHAQYLTMPYDELQLSEPSHLMHILGTESWHVASAYKSFTRLIVNFCSITVFAIFLTFLSWKIMAVSVAGTLILSFILRWLRKPAQELGQKFQLAHDKLGLAMVKTLYGMRTIRAYGQEAAQQQNFIKVSENAKVISNAQTRLATLIGPLTEAGYLAILCTIIEFSRWTNTSFAVTLAAFALLYRLQPHSREFEDNLLNLAQLQAQLREVRDTLESVGIASPDANAINIQNIKRDITFENVSLRYAGNLGYALENVSFSISAGNVTAIIGQSGAGKTTIINLLLRLYDPTEGRILVDGVDLQNIRREDWLGLIGAAGQDVDLVEGSIKENIGMAKIGCSDAEILTAARQAGVDEFVEPLKDGFDTWIGYHGMRFSGGQRQRLGLARALLRNPEVLILDEATSAIDLVNESRVRKTIEAQLTGRTILIITHRLETIREVDHVIWIEGGQTRASGKPAELTGVFNPEYWS